MKNDDNLKEKEIKQEKAMDQKELESVSGGRRSSNIRVVPVCTERYTESSSSCRYECIAACPQNAIYLRCATDLWPNINYEICNNCSYCESACPHQAISWTEADIGL
jgi:Fe-S-cluster-containing hydrogenase component 2